MKSMFDLSGKTWHGARVVISSRKQYACEQVASAINRKCGDPERAITIAAIRFAEGPDEVRGAAIARQKPGRHETTRKPRP